MQATDLYARLHSWCRAVLGNDAIVYQAFQNMPMQRGHALLIDPMPTVDSVANEVGNPGDNLQGSLVLRCRGTMTLYEINGSDWMYKLLKNLNNHFAENRLQASDLRVVRTNGPVSTPEIDDGSSQWYAHQTLVLTMEWLDVDTQPVESNGSTGPIESIREVVATQVLEDGSDGETIDVDDGTPPPNAGGEP